MKIMICNEDGAVRLNGGKNMSANLWESDDKAQWYFTQMSDQFATISGACRAFLDYLKRRSGLKNGPIERSRCRHRFGGTSHPLAVLS